MPATKVIQLAFQANQLVFEYGREWSDLILPINVDLSVGIYKLVEQVEAQVSAEEAA